MSANEHWENLFARSTEDVSTYQWAAEALLNPPAAYEPDYLVVLALCSRCRARAALVRVSGAPGEVYAKSIETLNNIWGRAEDILSGFAGQPDFFSEQLKNRVDYLAASLSRIRAATEDRILFGAEEEAIAEHRDMIHAFVLRFTTLSLAANELLKPPFSEINFAELSDSIKRLEDDFRNNSHCLCAITDLLPRMVEREYDHSPWWLNAPPEMAAFPEDVARSPFAPYADELRQEGAQAPRDCSQAGRVIALALGELAPPEAAAAREHVVMCHGCRRLFLDVMALSGAAPTEPAPDIWNEALRSVKQNEPGEKWPKLKIRTGRRLSSARWPFAALFLLVSAIAVISSIYGRQIVSFGRSAAPPDKNAITAQSHGPVTGPGQNSEQATFAPGPRKVALKITGRRRKGVAMGGLLTEYTEFIAMPGQTMKTGDEFKISFILNKASYAYLFFWGSAGDLRPLLRGSFNPNNAVTVPGGMEWYYLDAHPGIETIIILVSNKEIKDFDARLNKMARMDQSEIQKHFPDAQPFSFSINHEA